MEFKDQHTELEGTTIQDVLPDKARGLVPSLCGGKCLGNITCGGETTVFGQV